MSDEELANLAITLIHQATYMLRRLVERQQEMFLEGGGIREQMSRPFRLCRSELLSIFARRNNMPRDYDGDND